jgi:septal ring factor EnvC (AmiA/AmiB activator)
VDRSLRDLEATDLK